MVLSWRASEPQPSNRVFDGTGDVKMFLFYLENVILLGKEPHEKSLALLAYLDGDAFRFFFDRFTDAGELTE